MKNVIKTLIALSVLSSVAVNAATISSSDTDTTSFTIGGTIEAQCKVTSSLASGADTLDLTSSTSQAAASVNVWCNTGNQTTSTTYTSENAGFLLSDNGAKIAYQLDLDGTGADFTSPITVDQTAGSGTTGTASTTEVKVIPQLDGFETEGTYSDTITVTVAAN